MQIRFVKSIAFCTLTGLLAASITSTQVYADDSWGAILKPLMKEVIIPGASRGVKIWMERKNIKSQDDGVSPPSDWDQMSSPPSEDVTIFPPPEEPMYSEPIEMVIMAGEGSDAPPLPPPDPVFTP